MSESIRSDIHDSASISHAQVSAIHVDFSQSECYKALQGKLVSQSERGAMQPPPMNAQDQARRRILEEQLRTGQPLWCLSDSEVNALDGPNESNGDLPNESGLTTVLGEPLGKQDLNNLLLKRINDPCSFGTLEHISGSWRGFANSA